MWAGPDWDPIKIGRDLTTVFILHFFLIFCDKCDFQLFIPRFHSLISRFILQLILFCLLWFYYFQFRLSLYWWQLGLRNIYVESYIDNNWLHIFHHSVISLLPLSFWVVWVIVNHTKCRVSQSNVHKMCSDHWNWYVVASLFVTSEYLSDLDSVVQIVLGSNDMVRNCDKIESSLAKN